MPSLTFSILHHDTAPGSRARLGRVATPHGVFDTPAFMPVGTQGTVKGALPSLVAQTGAQIVLGNTYHLMLRPGSQLVAKMGGLQRWSGWGRPMLTDSGGFQVFSLADINKINDDGVTFKSHLDGRTIELTPELSMRVQNELGADIIMAFDDCPPAREQTEHQRARKESGVRGQESGVRGQESGGRSQESGVRGQETGGSDESDLPDSGLLTPDSFALTPDSSAMSHEEYVQRVQVANERTLRWLARCVEAHARKDEQALFGIVQGGTDLEQRTWCAERVTQHDLPGYAIGGVAVGEPPEMLRRVVRHTAPLLPADRPRYLMGVGYERDIVAAVRAGVDMFDCVLPTRNARNANAFTRTGQIRLKNAKFSDDPRPIEEGCDCAACGGWGQESGARGQGSSTTDSCLLTPDACFGFSRSYLRHLFMAGEMLGGVLVTLHNLRHFQRLLLDIRRAILHNDWSLLARDWPVAADGLRD